MQCDTCSALRILFVSLHEKQRLKTMHYAAALLCSVLAKSL